MTSLLQEHTKIDDSSPDVVDPPQLPMPKSPILSSGGSGRASSPQLPMPKSPILPSDGSGIASSSASAITPSIIPQEKTSTGATPLPAQLLSENQILVNPDHSRDFVDPDHSRDFAYGTLVQDTPLVNPPTYTEQSVYMGLTASMANPFDAGYRPGDFSGAHDESHQSMTSLLNTPLGQNIDNNGLWNGLSSLPGFDKYVLLGTFWRPHDGEPRA